jgi:superfamily II DNA or RNA helicase
MEEALLDGLDDRARARPPGGAALAPPADLSRAHPAHEHIDAIVEALDHLGDTALVLRGGLGKPARRAGADAIATHDPNSGIVLVATGSYLGEGFDWPELDTLFLAFPLAFKGRVLKYVSRLLRTHEGKHHVELHDFIDSRIPARPHAHQASPRLRQQPLRRRQPDDRRRGAASRRRAA